MRFGRKGFTFFEGLVDDYDYLLLFTSPGLTSFGGLKNGSDCHPPFFLFFPLIFYFKLFVFLLSAIEYDKRLMLYFFFLFQ